MGQQKSGAGSKEVVCDQQCVSVRRHARHAGNAEDDPIRTVHPAETVGQGKCKGAFVRASSTHTTDEIAKLANDVLAFEQDYRW